MGALYGDLEEGVLANLLQYLALSQASGQLSLRHPTQAGGDVYLDDGCMVHVSAGAREGVDALAELMAWQRGRFSFRGGVVAPRHTLSGSTDRLLLEASHLLDSGRAGLPCVDEDTVLITHTSADDGRAAVSLAALHVWRSVDGRSTVKALAVASGLPLAAVIEGASELVRSGLAAATGTILVDPAFVGAMTQEAVDILGPVAKVFVEDALFELGLEDGPMTVGALDELITTVATQFRRSEWQHDFLSRVERLRRDYGLSA
ncbi:MAG TPA: DUF4388 domain-containing protein [Trueperaceae bacterium]|nr:DUF4388 domain-containing protein [Trueperaceae bacterium]